MATTVRMANPIPGRACLRRRGGELDVITWSSPQRAGERRDQRLPPLTAYGRETPFARTPCAQRGSATDDR